MKSVKHVLTTAVYIYSYVVRLRWSWPFH